MNQKRRLAVLVILLLSLSFTGVMVHHHSAKAFSSHVLRKGATGNDVIELQARLQYIGFYKGKIDGKFGWGTYWALRNFQKNYGLHVDGLAGTNTKRVLSAHSYYNRSWVMGNINKGIPFTYYGGTPLSQQVKHTSTAKKSAVTNKHSTPTKSASVSHLPTGYSQSDLKLLANAVYGESRGESFVGQVAVAAVIVNRVTSSKFPDNVSGVIFQPGAFTAVQDGQIWLTPNKTAKKAVLDALNGWDPSQGALYYFNPATATSKWVWGRPQILKIGHHIFTK